MTSADARPAPAPPLTRADRGVGRRDPLEARGLVRFFVRPAAFIAANGAALIGALSVVGLVPALAGATRVTGDLAEHEDSAFRETLAHLRRTWRRDLPVSLLLLLVVAGILGNGLVLPGLEASLRVFAVGATLPVLWVLVSVLSAYVAVAALDSSTDRSTTVLRALALVMRRPLAALVAPALIVLLSPLWLLAPLTIACGLSVPPWVLGRLWSAGTVVGEHGGAAAPSARATSTR